MRECLLHFSSVGGLFGGSSVAAKTSLVLSDTVGTNFYIWFVGFAVN